MTAPSSQKPMKKTTTGTHSHHDCTAASAAVPTLAPVTSPRMACRPSAAPRYRMPKATAASRPIAPAAPRLPRRRGGSGACTKIGCGAGAAAGTTGTTGSATTTVSAEDE
jgi:hypothetical protein